MDLLFLLPALDVVRTILEIVGLAVGILCGVLLCRAPALYLRNNRR